MFTAGVDDFTNVSLATFARWRHYSDQYSGLFHHPSPGGDTAIPGGQHSGAVLVQNFCGHGPRPGPQATEPQRSLVSGHFKVSIAPLSLIHI